MLRHLESRKNTYRDSVSLMLLANQMKALGGIDDVAVLIGTEANKRRLREAGFESLEMNDAGSNDLLVGLLARDADSLNQAIEHLEQFLEGRSQTQSSVRLPRSLHEAVSMVHGTSIVSISTPGEFAAAEARKALDLGIHVFLFSDNVPVTEEIDLKQRASQAGLLMMGPDCGTARIAGTPLGFCNRVPDGPVGIVTASGTGAQEVMCQLARFGIGVSHVIGTGGRDLGTEVNALGTEQAVSALLADEATAFLIVISKPPSPLARQRLIDLLSSADKPVLVHFVGDEELIGTEGILSSPSLADAAEMTAARIGGQSVPEAPLQESALDRHRPQLEQIINATTGNRRWIRGLFAGGTLADEAAHVISKTVSPVFAGVSFGRVRKIESWARFSEHTIADLGDDKFTVGRPHPMIDPEVRGEILVREGQDPEVAIILMDFVLGLNASHDPVGEMIPWFQKAGLLSDRSGGPALFTHVVGTEDDPQGMSDQVRQLEDCGAMVFASNASAARAAALVAKGIERKFPRNDQ